MSGLEARRRWPRTGPTTTRPSRSSSSSPHTTSTRYRHSSAPRSTRAEADRDDAPGADLRRLRGVGGALRTPPARRRWQARCQWAPDRPGLAAAVEQLRTLLATSAGRRRGRAAARHPGRHRQCDPHGADRRSRLLRGGRQVHPRPDGGARVPDLVRCASCCRDSIRAASGRSIAAPSFVPTRSPRAEREDSGRVTLRLQGRPESSSSAACTRPASRRCSARAAIG